MLKHNLYENLKSYFQQLIDIASFDAKPIANEADLRIWLYLTNSNSRYFGRGHFSLSTISSSLSIW